MYKHAKKIIVLAIILLLLDAAYIYSLNNYFKQQVFRVQGTPLKLDMISAVLCYVLLIFGLYYFIYNENKSLLDAFLLGIFVYGVYELTSKALLVDWDWNTVVIDTLWGGILFTTTIFIMRKLKI
jgi:uncharacterized membrane protein